MKLEELKRDAVVQGILPHEPVTIVDVTWYGSDAVEVTYKDPRGAAGNELLFRDDEVRLELAGAGKAWRSDVDGDLLKLASEARRIQLGYLFDPFLSVHTSMIDPLPHQITAVYEKMLPRQPLRFLLADDPGAGKTIMAGLYIKELMIRGDVRRCLVVCPGGLAEQWQDELWQRFQLPFEILTNDRIEAARTGNALAEMSLVIARLDKLARDETLQEKLALTDWDLIVVDEAHKMSASYYGNEVKYTKRYRLGQLLSLLTRHFLLMTATPHNGKETDFQLFMALLDPDRFEGKYREGYSTDVRDLMRRMVKEELLKFDGTPLFPERRAYTVPYKLSDLEAKLYEEVTSYVREEFNRAERLQNGGRKGTVGFALTILQRRLASSPEAIYQSLKRRRERLESRLREVRLISRGLSVGDDILSRYVDWSEEDIDDLQDELTAETLESLEEQVLDQATAAQTVEELEAEIHTLKRLEKLANIVRNSGQDRKWEELSRLLQDKQIMFDPSGQRRKLVIFTEHRDTLTYLADRIRTLLGRPEAVVTIHGGVRRDERRLVQEQFTQHEEVSVLVATDAAGEGINLQRAHLMINYDLPWNPNRLEQRFGRIHRIGQTEVCHLWNLVAEETREGDVYLTLLRKLERERATLGGAVFDVLGKAIPGAELRRLMIDAIRYGDRPEVRARLLQKVEGALDEEHLRALLSQDVLAREVMDPRQVFEIRQEMERMEARRLQPHYIQAFFLAAFQTLGGVIRQREHNRFQIKRVPAPIRQRARLLGYGDHVMRSYERICFEKDLRNVPGKPPAEFIAPGHPLLDAVTSLIYEQHGPLIKQGAVLVDEKDPGEVPRALVYLEHSIRDVRLIQDGRRRVISRRMQFVEIPLQGDGGVRNAGYAPYLDYRPLDEEEQALVAEALDLLPNADEIERQAMSYAIVHLAPSHIQEVRAQREPLIEKTMAAVKERLTKEIIYWNNRAVELQLREEAGKPNARLNSLMARRRAQELEDRLKRRLAELEEERKLSAAPPAVVGRVLVLPKGLLDRLKGKRVSEPTMFARERERVEMAAMDAVMAAERALGHEPRDVSKENVGYDIESFIPGQQGGRLRFIEVKGRIEGATTVTISRNEILTALNKPEDWVLALVEVPIQEEMPVDVVNSLREPRAVYGKTTKCQVRYVHQPFSREPDFAAISVNYKWDELWSKGQSPDRFEYDE